MDIFIDIEEFDAVCSSQNSERDLRLCDSFSLSEKAESPSSNSSEAGEIRRYPNEPYKTVLAFMFLAASVVCTNLALAIVHDRLPERPPLQDVVFSVIPAYELGLAISEYLIMACFYPLLLLLFSHRHRWIVFRRLFLILGVLYFGRGLTMFVTAVPLANRSFYCAPKLNHTTIGTIAERVVHITLGFGMSINGRHIYCGDFIYSGHTCMLVTCYLFFDEYLPKTGRLAFAIRNVVLLCSVAGVISVTVSRIHYTIDVLIAYSLTTLVFRVYHTVAAHPELKASALNNHISNMWFFHIFAYSEQSVPAGRLPVRFNWPLPWWPRRFSSWRLVLDVAE